MQAAVEENPVQADDDLAIYKRLVRETAIELIENQNWCAEGANPVLVKLGLDPMPVRQYFTLEMPVQAIASCSFHAIDEADALRQYEKQREDLGAEHLRYWDTTKVVSGGEPTVRPQGIRY